MREINSLDYKQELMDSELGYWLRQAEQVEESTLLSLLRKTIGHPQYRRNRYTSMVIDIMQKNGDFTARQRACLEIHYAVENIKLFPDQGLEGNTIEVSESIYDQYSH